MLTYLEDLPHESMDAWLMNLCGPPGGKHNLGGGKMAVRENIANIIGEANFDLDFYCFDYLKDRNLMHFAFDELL